MGKTGISCHTYPLPIGLNVKLFLAFEFWLGFALRSPQKMKKSSPLGPPNRKAKGVKNHSPTNSLPTSLVENDLPATKRCGSPHHGDTSFQKLTAGPRGKRLVAWKTDGLTVFTDFGGESFRGIQAFEKVSKVL